MKIDAGPFMKWYGKGSLLIVALSTINKVFPQVQTVTLNFHGLARAVVESRIWHGDVPVALINYRRLALPDIIVTGLDEVEADLVKEALL